MEPFIVTSTTTAHELAIELDRIGGTLKLQNQGGPWYALLTTEGDHDRTVSHGYGATPGEAITNAFRQPR